MSALEMVWIVVKDFKAALKFYSEVVGLRIMEVNEEYGWAELQGSSGIRLGIARPDDSNPIGPGQNGVITFTVKDLEQAKKTMMAKGAKLVGDIQDIPGHVRLQTVKDLDGNHFQLVQILTS